MFYGVASTVLGNGTLFEQSGVTQHVPEGAEESVREWATAALEEIGVPQASDLTQFAELLGSPNPDVAYWAATMIGRLEEAAGLPTPEFRRSTIYDCATRPPSRENQGTE